MPRVRDHVVQVGALTPLSDWIDCSSYAAVRFALINQSPDYPVTFFLETSEDQVRIDETETMSETTPANGMRSIKAADDQLHTFFRLSAQTSGPGWPTANVRWLLLVAHAR